MSEHQISEQKPGTDWIVAGGEMGQLIRSMDWSRTPLGARESWPQSLRTTINICLASDLPICIIWGPGLVQIYNDGYRVICGDKHPRSMGQNFPECWRDAWPVIGAAHDSALAGNTAFLENQHIFLERHGYTEECFFTLSFSPILDEAGRLAGLFHPVIEMTPKMLGDRRTRTLRDMATRTGHAKSIAEALTLTTETLAGYELDLPFVLIYRLDEVKKVGRLIAATGLSAGMTAAPELVDLAAPGNSSWPLAEVSLAGAVVQVDDVEQRFGKICSGPFPEFIKAAVLLPIMPPGAERPIAVVVAGISPRLSANEMYRGFYDLLASAVTTTVANARAYEGERKRAEALAEIDRAKTTFFSNVSHEFRTPLTLMLGPTEDLLALPPDSLTPEVRRQLDLIHRNSLRLQNLVNTLLDFSRFEAGRIQASYAPTDLAVLTGDLASVFRSAIEKAGLKLLVDCPPLAEPVYVDRDMWEKVVLNLLSNAFKFTLAGEIQLTQKDTGHAVQLSVRDTGTGIAAEELPRIFERFHRVEGAPSRTHEGTGIGLALVQGLVKLHGGTVDLESVLGKGSTFTVTVPKGTAHLPADRIEVNSALASTALTAGHYVEEAMRWLPDGSAGVAPETSFISSAPPNGAPETRALPRILLADDNADMRDYVRRLLSERYLVQAVADGEAALIASRENPPDLILSDVMMPRLDGYGLLRELRADPRTRSIPVVLLSARAGEESRVAGMESDADDYLVKPFSGRELLARVGAHLNLAQFRNEAYADMRNSGEQRTAMNEALLIAGLRQHELTEEAVKLNEQLQAEIAERRQTEEKLRESELALKRALDYAEATLRTTPVPFLVLRADLRVNTASEAFYTDFKVRPAETEGRLIYEIGNGQWNIPKLRELLEEIIPKKKVFNGFEVTHEFATIGTRTMLLNARRMDNAEGAPERILLAIEDITQRVQASQYARSLIEASLDPLVTISAEGKITDVNEGSIKVTGVAREKLIGTDFSDYFTEPRKAREGYQQVFAKGFVTDYPLTIRHQNGRLTDVLYNASVYKDVSGRVLGVFAAARDVTGRKQAEEMLARLGSIVSSADDGILSKTLDGVVTTWNASAERLFGYTAEEIIGNPNLHLTPPDLHHEEEYILKQILAGEPINHFETQRMTKDGRRLQVSLTISPIKDTEGKVVGASKIVRDITERKQAEEALRESEQFTRRVLDNLFAFVGVTTADGTVTDANRAPLEAAGIPASEVLGKKFWDCYWWNYSPEIQAQLRDACERAASGEIMRFDVPVRMAGDTRVWIDFQIAPLRDTEGRITHLIPSAMDIAVRRAAEEKLRESEERFRVAALAVSDLIWTNNAQGMMEGEQPGWAQFTGQTREEYQGHGWAQAVHPDDAQPTIRAWNAAVAEKRLFEFEHRVRRRDGVWRSCSIRAVPVIGGDGEVREWVGVHNDITERKRSSAALIEAKEHAEAASNAKDNFLATLSHELRTPLTPALMTATALASDPTLPAEAREQLDMMRRNIELEARLIDDLLDLTRIIHGKLIIAPVTADIHELLLHTDEIIRSDGLGKRLRIMLKLDAARHHALADPARLQQVFWNLLRNAVKFTPDGGTITVSSRNDAQGRIIISVADDGIGIRAEVLSQIFNAFEQADTTGEHQYGGLGLGLAISSAIVTAHGGEIKAESQGRGHGAEFTVTLGSVPAPAATSPQNATPDQPPRALSLLVVEDHETTRTVLERLLTHSGHRVTTASTLHEALAAYNAAHFDAVISDLGLPDGSGIDLMVQIQSIRPVPAIALSGYGMEADLQRSKAAGFFAHLVKPVNMDQIKQLLTQIPVQAGQHGNA